MTRTTPVETKATAGDGEMMLDTFFRVNNSKLFVFFV
jgi:hypothetical protein